MVEVKTLALDDLIGDLGGNVFLLKIDTQGYEANVFDGLRKVIDGTSKNKVRYILFEYWADAIDTNAGLPLSTCSSTNILKDLSKEYDLFDLTVSQHPKAPNVNNEGVKNQFTQKFFRPRDFMENCKWFADRGNADRSNKATDYKMGYWTDFLAVYKGDFDSSEADFGSLGKRPSFFI